MSLNTNVVRQINESGHKIYIAITGGGQTFLGDFLSISGASKTIVGAIIPYSPFFFDKFVKNAKVDSYASEEAARKLAVASFNECREALGKPIVDFSGVGVACSLAKENEREGREHRVHIAVHDRSETLAVNVILKQGRTRIEEEEFVKELILKVIFLWILGCPISGVKEQLQEGESYSLKNAREPDHVSFISGLSDHLFYFSQEVSPLVIFPGSWNPIHEGHRQIIKLSTQILGACPVLELTVSNADKGQLDFIDIKERVKQISEYPYALTKEATFVGKARLFRRLFPKEELIFVVGSDTWERIWEAKYAGTPFEVESIFEQLKVKFLVFGRNNADLTKGFGHQLRIKNTLAESFHNPTSSTIIRRMK
jgi:nicotinic acid mononucleotide adenylyltransferase/nicotinamide mononucleotide (NMN) deamidase PncC